MSKARINQITKERCLLTEIAPYETPILFSNWGSYNYCRVLSKGSPPNYLKLLFTQGKLSIPYKYRIKKDGVHFRTLSLVHPHHSQAIVNFYQKYDVTIIRACRRSPLSLRAPHRVAKFFILGKASSKSEKEVEDITAETAYASSYFAYNRYSHLHKFFESDDFTELEKKFTLMAHLDIAKFFPSLYSHSISWAIRGKKKTKDNLFGPDNPKKAFDSVFDGLLRSLNYQETHGIPIGPELCRIFSEIILQKVDASLIANLKESGYELGKHFWCYRYIDDYFIFYNEERTRLRFANVLSEELEKFKLYLNEEKDHATTRPFISALSVRKIEISQFLDTIALRRDDLEAASSSREIDKLRALTKDPETPFSSVSTYLLSSLLNQIRLLYSSQPENLFDALYIYLDLAFHTFRMDIRVATSFKITTILLEVLAKLDRLNLSDRAKVMDKIVFEIRGGIESATFQGASLECSNLIIANAVFASKFPLPSDLLNLCIKQLREQNNDEYSTEKRLTYFQIVSFLYYAGTNPQHAAIKDEMLNEARAAIGSYNPCEHAETAFLLLDLVSCPFLNDNEKNLLIRTAMSHVLTPPLDADIGHFRNFVSRSSWYFNWTPARETGLEEKWPFDSSRHAKLRIHLKKKQLLLAY